MTIGDSMRVDQLKAIELDYVSEYISIHHQLSNPTKWTPVEQLTARKIQLDGVLRHLCDAIILLEGDKKSPSSGGVQMSGTSV